METVRGGNGLRQFNKIKTLFTLVNESMFSCPTENNFGLTKIFFITKNQENRKKKKTFTSKKIHDFYILKDFISKLIN